MSYLSFVLVGLFVAGLLLVVFFRRPRDEPRPVNDTDADEFKRRVEELERRTLAYCLYRLCAEEHVDAVVRQRLRHRYGTELARPHLLLDSRLSAARLGAMTSTLKAMVVSRGEVWVENRLPLAQLEDAIVNRASRDAADILAAETSSRP